MCHNKNLLDPFLKLCTILKIPTYLQSLFSISCIYFPFFVGGVGQSGLSQARKISLTCPFWYQNRNTNWYTNSSDEGLTLETAAIYPLTVTNFRYNYSTIERPGEETHWRFLHAQGVRRNDSWAVPLLRLLQYFSSSILIFKWTSISLIFQFVFVSYFRIYPWTFFLNYGWLSR